MERRQVVIIGGGAAGLSAAYALKKQGINPILLEANDRVGGRLGGDRVDGFHIDGGADFFSPCSDEALRLSKELGLNLVRSRMNLGWRRNGRWVVTTPVKSIRGLFKNLGPFREIGFLSPGAFRSLFRLVKEIQRQAEFLNFHSNSRMHEIDDEETFDEYLNRIGVPENLQVSLRGFLKKMTMGDIEHSGQAYMRTYIGQILLQADQLYVPEYGVGALAHALGAACAGSIRLTSPVRRVVVRDGVATGVILDTGPVQADAVICAIPATRVPDIIPNLTGPIRSILGTVRYSTGCRVVIGLDHPPLPAGWYGALYPEDDTPLLLDRSITLPACVPPGMSTLDLLAGRRRAEELLSLDDDEIKCTMLRDARRNTPPGSALPRDDEGIFSRVYRWNEAVCMGHPGMFEAVGEIRGQLSRETNNLFLAGDYMQVPSINGALASGVDAARQVMDLFARGSA